MGSPPDRVLLVSQLFFSFLDRKELIFGFIYILSPGYVGIYHIGEKNIRNHVSHQ